MENLELSVVKTCFQEHGITQTSSNSLLTNENDRGCESSDIKEKRFAENIDSRSGKQTQCRQQKADVEGDCLLAC